jgi:hypothetical protein
MGMNLECSLVEDLYPLYEEKELRPENHQAVNEHLKICENCRELYRKGSGFSELPLSTESGEEKLPKKVDDRIRLRFKLKRMKVVAALLAAIIIVTGINHYAANREKVAVLMDGVYQYSESLNEIVKNPYEITSNKGMLSYSANDIVDLDNELNWIERKNKSYPLLINSQEFDEMAAILEERKKQGLENKTDLKAIELLQGYSNTLFKRVQKEYREFHHGYSSYFEILDVAEIGEPIDKISELTYFYSRYHKLPSEMKLVNENELKKKIKTAFNVKNSDVKLEKTNPINENYGVYHFKLKQGKTNIDGKIDGYTGLIIFAENNSQRTHNKKPQNSEVVMKKAEKMLKAIYGQTANFDIKVESFDVQPKLYRLQYTPLSGKYQLNFPFESLFYIEFDAETGEFSQLSGEPSLPTNGFFLKNFEEKLTADTIENKAAQILGKKSKAIRKSIIYSTVSADYVLVHIFEGKENWIYINAETGIAESPYLPIH